MNYMIDKQNYRSEIIRIESNLVVRAKIINTYY
jgi:hypothetical protein